MPVQLSEYLARVRSDDGSVVGAAFLVAPRTIVTCAHVVARALGKPDTLARAPKADLTLDFPLLGAESTVSAHVVEWRPVDAPGGDIAILETADDAPDGAVPARLMKSTDVFGHSFRSFGFPVNRDDGVWATGILRDRQAAGWLQIDHITVNDFAVQAGFSGAPVVEEVLGGVIGMAVAAEDTADNKTAYVTPTELLLAAWPDLTNQSIAACPYRSLRPFDRGDHDIFFGREKFVQERLLPATRREALVAVIIGSSGSGKSSVVFAGLIPELLKEPGWVTGDFRPGLTPFHAIAAVIEDWLEPDRSEADRVIETRKLGDALEAGEIEVTDLAERLDQKARQGAGNRFLLVADQFEELFSRSDPKVQQRFLKSLVDTVTVERGRATPRLTIVLTMRADFMQQALEYGPFADVLQDSTQLLGAMSRDDLAAAIEKPATMLAVEFEPGLVDRILDDVGDEAGRLPLMQFALTLLWAEQEDGTLTHDAYRAIGEVEGALALHAENVYAALNDEKKEHARRLFIQLVHADPNGKDTRRVATRTELGRPEWDLAQQLTYQRLVVTGRDEVAQEDTVELIHETLLTHWDRLTKWVNADRTFRDWQERTRTAFDLWEDIKREDAGLLRGSVLAEAEGWRSRREADLGEEEKEIIQASVTERDRAAADREAGLNRQIRIERLLRRAFSAAAGLLVVALVALYLFLTTSSGFDPVAFVFGSGIALSENPMVAQAGGPIVFGSDEAVPETGEQTTQTVPVAAFAIQRSEVTNRQFRLCRHAAACRSDPVIRTQFDDPAYDRYPVVNVNALQATEYCTWLGARLPDTYEWERAARGPDGRPWPWGDATPTPERANQDPSTGLVEPGRLVAGATPDGIVDLIGNAWEWTRTQADAREDGTYSLQEWDGKRLNIGLVQRGGSWGFQMSRVTEVQVADPTLFSDFVGFRCARSSG